MFGIVSYGAHVPIYRLSREVLGTVWGGSGKGERAVANWDEDSLTMAVEAGTDCLMGIDRESVDALYFATTTPPYKEKQSASIIAAALDLKEDVIAVDFADSLRSGTIAIKLAMDAVKAGTAKKVLVVAADCRIAAPNSVAEPVFGDGAVALLIGGGDGVVVEIKESYHLTSEFLDVWRLEYDKYTRTWEDRFVIDQGYHPHLNKAVTKLLKAYNMAPKDFARVAIYGPDKKSHAAMVKSLGLDAKTQVQDPLFDQIGNTGAASALMTLVGALEQSKPGDKILLGNYGDGADAHILQVRDGIEKLGDRRGIRKNVDSKMMLENYGKYIKYKSLMQFEQIPDTRNRTSLPVLWRGRNWVYRFHGHKCQKCGKTQFPMQKACMYCQAKEELLEEVKLWDRKGTLFTFSMDERAAVIDPPNVIAAVNLDGGGRIFSQMTDRDPSKLKIGMPMGLTFRLIHDSLGVHNYFWKCRPERG